jgi:TIR domain-containing protein
MGPLAMSNAGTNEERPVRPGQARIFISYRRRETAGHAGRLYDALVEHFGTERVFMDVTMEPGVDFAETISAAVGSCGALVALIGEEWLTVTDAQGNRRIDDPTDVHRMELEAALDRGVRLIPAVVQDADMPTADDLPDDLKPLVRRQAVELSDQRWDYDVSRLVSVLERVMADAADAGRPAGRTAGLRRRWRRAVARGRRVVVRYRGRAGFVAGALSALIVVGILLAATGYFDSPLLRITSFEYTPPPANESVARRCLVRAESDYRVRSVRFVIDGDERNSLPEQTSPPWQCNNRGSRNVWDTCEGHSRGFPLDPDRPHTLTATVTDSQGNTASRTRTVDTNCPRAR